MPRKKFKNKKKSQLFSQDNIMGIIILSLSLVFITSIVVFYIFKKQSIDPNTSCLKDLKETPEKLVILVDATSKFTQSQIQALQGFKQKLFNEIPQYAKVVVYKLSGAIISSDDQLISICSPLNPNESNPLIDTKKYVERNWTNKFENKIVRGIEDLSKTKGFKASPIIESIRAVSLLEFSVKDAKKQKLIVISDFIENSDNLSMYRDGVPKIKKLREDKGRAFLSARLNNVEVNFLVLENFPELQGKSFQDFWFKYALSNNAVVGNGSIRSIINF